MPILDPGSGPIVAVGPRHLHPAVDAVPADRVRTRRHTRGCSYLPVDQVWRDATPDEMRDLRACRDCVNKADR